MGSRVDYIKQCRKQGYSDTYIRNALRQAGHQEPAIDHSFIQAKSMNVRPFIFVILALALVGSLTGILLLQDNTTGYVVQEPDLEVVKAAILEQEVAKINEMDVSVVEKQERIQELTRQIDALFIRIELERQQNMDSSLELINNMLNR
tara:strand:- start:477 stop:920 length:444 start_codon:yes stop_codon:yes gene_type:complete